jgi:RNase H-fold protein (predicted Holliday junction resolvase)
MIEAGIKRRRRAENIDAVAASIILQGALDRLSRLA